MKKIYSLMLALTLCVAGCQKGGITLRLETEPYLGHGEKLHVEEGFSTWDNGDQVIINGETYTVEVDGNNAVISDVEDAGYFQAAYPVSLLKSIGGNYLEFELPAVQEYRTSGGRQVIEAVMGGKCRKGDPLKFHNMESLLKITVTTPMTTHIRKIKLQDVKGGALSGTAQLAQAGEGGYDNFMLMEGCDSVVLDCGLGVSIEADSSKDFYIVLPPDLNGAQLAITIVDDFQTFTHTLSGLLSTARNQIYSLSFATNGTGVHATPHAKPLCNQIFYTVTPGEWFSPDELRAAYGEGGRIQEFNGWHIFTAPQAIKEIRGGVFNNAHYVGNRGLNTVVLPEGLTKIGNSAFAFCWGMKGITLPSTLTYIGDTAFWGAEFQEIELPEGLTHLGRFAFCMTWLSELEWPAAITEVPEGLLSRSRIYSVTFPEGVTKIDKEAFSWCNVLSSHTVLPNSLTEIGEEAFAHNQGVSDSPLFEITIPSGVTKIGSRAFVDIWYLDTVYMKPMIAPTIGEHVFSDTVKTIFVPQGSTGYDQGGWAAYSDRIETISY